MSKNGLRQSEGELKVSKIDRNGLNSIFKMNEWSLKYRLLDQCSHSFTSRDKSCEYLARFYTFYRIKKIKKLIFYEPVKSTLAA
jgi:hypothetical protein